MVKATHKHRTATRNKRRITAHSDAGKVSRKQLQKGLSKKFQKKLDVVKRKRRKKVAREARLRAEQRAAQAKEAEAKGMDADASDAHAIEPHLTDERVKDSPQQQHS